MKNHTNDHLISMTMSAPKGAKQVLDFWFDDETQKNWFAKSDEFDDLCRTRFLATWHDAKDGKTKDWRINILGRLAEIIVLDQFSRNIYRNLPQAFSQDDKAVELAQIAVCDEHFPKLYEMARNFVLMPFMHSENKMVHDKALPYFEQYASPNTLDFEHKHKVIIERFGRYPHRNQILGRTCSQEELEFLQEPNSSF